MDLYVSPEGTDGASGQLREPFGSVTAAVRAARSRPSGEPCTIWLRGGTYSLAELVVLTPEDSGITIAAYKRERPVLSGGRRIEGWKVAGNLWEAEVKDWYFRSLFVNGNRAVTARTPNTGRFFRMEEARLSDKPIQFKFAKGDIKPHWAQEPDAVIVGFEKWTDFRRHIRAFVREDNVVRLSGDGGSHTRESGARYFVENARFRRRMAIGSHHRGGAVHALARRGNRQGGNYRAAPFAFVHAEGRCGGKESRAQHRVARIDFQPYRLGDG
jgi:hypothetical protein